MHVALGGQINDWKYGRGIILDLLKNVKEADLDTVFPRNELNSIRKQCEELIKIQTDYIQAIKTGKMEFRTEMRSYETRYIIDVMNGLDNELFDIANNLSGDEKISWFGEDKTIFEHLSAMIGHEQMHIGQIIAFMFAVNIDIPTTVKRTMGLSD